MLPEYLQDYISGLVFCEAFKVDTKRQSRIKTQRWKKKKINLMTINNNWFHLHFFDIPEVSMNLKRARGAVIWNVKHNKSSTKHLNNRALTKQGLNLSRACDIFHKAGVHNHEILAALEIAHTKIALRYWREKHKGKWVAWSTGVIFYSKVVFLKIRQLTNGVNAVN